MKNDKFYHNILTNLKYLKKDNKNIYQYSWFLQKIVYNKTIFVNVYH
jgi:hypothetical protein